MRTLKYSGYYFIFLFVLIKLKVKMSFVEITKASLEKTAKNLSEQFLFGSHRTSVFKIKFSNLPHWYYKSL